MHLLRPWTLFQVWCHVAPLVMVQAAPRPDPDLAPDPSAALQPAPEPEAKMNTIPAVPLAMAWLGSIGGVLGIISFTESYITRLVEAIKAAAGSPNYDPKKGEPSWVVGVQVGLDGHGLKGAGGEFPQFCLWNTHGQLIGYNDQRIRYQNPIYKYYTEVKDVNPMPKGMPFVESGSLVTRGIWPPEGQEALGKQQAAYITMIKRQINAICVASVYVQWPDETRWVFDGTWGRASNMSWYYAFVYDSDSRQQECFWLDARGDLKHKKDLEEQWFHKQVKAITGKEEYYDWLNPTRVIPETGIPEGDRLTEGMRENGVHEYKVPMGVKWHVPAFKAGKYRIDGDNVNNLTQDDFVQNPAKMNWFMEPMRRKVRGGNPVLPILQPWVDLSEKNPTLIWEDENNQNIPEDCLTDWYYDSEDSLVEPGTGKRCIMYKEYGGKDGVPCRQGWNGRKGQGWETPEKRTRRMTAQAADGAAAESPSPSLHEQHARTLVNDQNRRGGSGTKKLCEDPNSVGPSYANHQERLFCRMTDKTLWPFCDSAAEVFKNCYDAEAEVLVEETRPVGKRTLYWDYIEDWHSNDRFRRAA